jgi:hypothetical protein
MPVFRITYATPHRQDETDWVCPAGYTVRKARQTFCQQHPSAAIASTVRVPESDCMEDAMQFMDDYDSVFQSLAGVNQ